MADQVSIYARLLQDAIRDAIGSADPHPREGHVHSDRCRPYEAYTGPILQGRRGETVTRGRVHV